MRTAIKQSILTITSLLVLTGAAGAETIVVPAGGNLASAVNAAACGDTVSVEAGATFRGPIELTKQCPATNPIVIQSSRVSELPQGRVNPQHSPLMPKILAPPITQAKAPQAIITVGAASGYNFIGIEVLPDPASTVFFDLVQLGQSKGEQNQLSQVPHHLKVDRCYIHGDGVFNFQRGISLNSSDSEVTRSYISNITGAGVDAQAIAGWNTPGRLKIEDNYLEATGENIMFGGADAASEAFIPSDIQIIRNHVFKPLSWKVGDPSYAGKWWTIKNLLELKNARHVTIIGNVFENNWEGQGQSGVAILFTVRNQDCTNPFATVQNITFTHNTIKNTGGIFNFLGKDNEAEPTYEDRAGHPKCSDPGESYGSVRGSGFTGSNNLLIGIRGPVITLNGFDNITIDRNTDFGRTWNLTTVYGQPSQGFRYTNNITFDHEYGIVIEGGKKVGDPTGLLPGGAIDQNIVVGATDPSSWPATNQLIASLTLPPDFRSPFAGKGADIDALSAAQSGATSQPLPSPSPTSTPAPSPTPLATPTPQPTPSATPVPSPTPVPTPLPTPSPTPIPTPAPCAMTIDPLSLAPWSSGTLTVRTTNATGALTAVSSTGQIQVFPKQVSVSGTSSVAQFGVRSKNRGGQITVSGPCGSQTVTVNVR